MSRMLQRALAGLLVFALTADAAAPAALAQEAAAAAPKVAAPLPSAPSPDYRVGAGDVLQISVFPVEEYSREVTVQPDGMVELALVGTVLVKGLTIRELEGVLTQKYSKYVASPKISVDVRRFSGRRIAILGEVRAPGFYEYRDGMKLLEIVSLAGGVTDTAKPSATRILRYGVEHPETVKANLAAVLNGGYERNILLVPGDTVFVPKGRLTRSTTWININILPWLTLLTLISSSVILVRQ